MEYRLMRLLGSLLRLLGFLLVEWGGGSLERWPLESWNMAWFLAISSREAGWRPYWPLEREPGMIPEVGCVRLAAGSLMWPNFEFGSMMLVVTVSPIDLGWMGMVLEVSFDMMARWWENLMIDWLIDQTMNTHMMVNDWQLMNNVGKAHQQQLFMCLLITAGRLGPWKGVKLPDKLLTSPRICLIVISGTWLLYSWRNFPGSGLLMLFSFAVSVTNYAFPYMTI